MRGELSVRQLDKLLCEVIAAEAEFQTLELQGRF